MGKDTIKKMVFYEKKIVKKDIHIYDRLSKKIIFIIDRARKEFMIINNLKEENMKKWFDYFEENKYKRIKGE